MNVLFNNYEYCTIEYLAHLHLYPNAEAAIKGKYNNIITWFFAKKTPS